LSVRCDKNVSAQRWGNHGCFDSCTFTANGAAAFLYASFGCEQRQVAGDRSATKTIFGVAAFCNAAIDVREIKVEIGDFSI